MVMMLIIMFRQKVKGAVEYLTTLVPVLLGERDTRPLVRSFV